MAAHLFGVPDGSLVHRFITSGKPGHCELCSLFVQKLEAHHIKYSPEVTIKLCHNCHHKTHFWPLRLSVPEKKKLFSKIHNEKESSEISQKKFLRPEHLACLIAPSRNAFIHAQQQKEFLRSGPK